MSKRKEEEAYKCRARQAIPCTPCGMCRGKEKVSSQSKRSPRAPEFFPKSPSLQYLIMNWTVNGYGHPSASKSMPSANTSGEPSSPCTTSTHMGMLPSSISGSFEQTPSPLKPTEVKGESSSKHAASTTPAITTHRRTG